MAHSQLSQEQFPIGVPGLFGLARDQVLAVPLLHNSNWYNKNGRWLANGDLSVEHVGRIMREIRREELIVVMEQGSYSALYHTLRNTNVKELPPRLLGKHAKLIILRDRLLHVTDNRRNRKGKWFGITCTDITPEQAIDVLTGVQ